MSRTCRTSSSFIPSNGATSGAGLCGHRPKVPAEQLEHLQPVDHLAGLAAGLEARQRRGFLVAQLVDLFGVPSAWKNLRGSARAIFTSWATTQPASACAFASFAIGSCSSAMRAQTLASPIKRETAV